MISIIEFKRYVAGTNIFNIVVDKLSYKKKSCPIILFEIDKNQNVNLYYAILSLDLAIRL